MITENLLDIAEKNTQSLAAENISELLEQESRRYSRKLSEEEEVKLR